jgi:small subunit ribosomal protein S9
MMTDSAPLATTSEQAPSAVPASIPELPDAKRPYYWGTGRRKTAVARVRIKSGSGVFKVNDRELTDFFRLENDRGVATHALSVTETGKTVDVFVNVSGGGITGQAGAVALGLARALVKANPQFEPKLRATNLLTRDSRKVERKKYGQAGARRRFQYSKR